MPLCIKNTLQKIFILDTTPTVLDLLTWDLVPRWTISFYLDYLNDHYSPTHNGTSVTLFRKSDCLRFAPRYTIFCPTHCVVIVARGWFLGI